MKTNACGLVVLFFLLGMFPLNKIPIQVCQLQSGRHRCKGKIGQPELNKLLQSECGFTCTRSRKRSTSRFSCANIFSVCVSYYDTYTSCCIRLHKYFSCSVAGHWLFSRRKWLNPCAEEDYSTLVINYSNLCTLFPKFSKCSQETLFNALTDLVQSWNASL